MVYPNNFEQKTGFDTIRQLLKQYCQGTPGQAFVDKMQFSANYETILKLGSQVAEFKQIIETGDNFPDGTYTNFQPFLRKVEIENAFLEEAELHQLRLSLHTAAAITRFFATRHILQYIHLRKISEEIEVDRGLLQRIDFVLDDKGRLRDTASSELQRIRRSLIAVQGGLRRRMETILKEAQASGLVAEDSQVTIRNGRAVLPVLAEHKRHIRGFIHDESATGQTVFLEPAELFEANNSIRELEYEERREIIKILTQLTDAARPHLPALRRAYTFLGMVDFIRAKAKLAMEMKAALPKTEKKQLVTWVDARHPLLQLSLAAQGRSVVPLTINLNADSRILVISGPNAGGKSVVLKSVALVQYMFQCGMLVPIADYSIMGLFDEILLDMGDEQSLENDLSTYSSHLTNMRYFMQFANKKTLFLIDEFGTGTEPQFGGAIAASILLELNHKNAFGVVTTHYGNLKDLAGKTPGLGNAAMRFDVNNLAPMYIMEAGKPGSSFALEIAGKIGLPAKVLNQARHFVGDKTVRVDKLLNELEADKQKYEALIKEAETAKRKVDLVLKDNMKLQDLLTSQRTSTITDAKAEARRLLKETNKRIEGAIKDIKVNQAEKEATKLIRKELEEYTRKLEAPVIALKPRESKIVPVDGPITGGDYVRFNDSDTVAEVIAVAGKDVEIRIGALKSKVKLNRLQKISRSEYLIETAEENARPAMKGVDMNQRMAGFSASLDIRGRRGEEALGIIDGFIDDALMLGVQELRIVHGKGDGILRQLVRNHLNGYKQVARLTDEHADRGGAGVTVVTLA